MNPQGTSVFGFKQPSKDEAAHDFLWRAHLHTPGKGEVVIFNRSHYEDVLVVRVHKLAEKSVWSKRYDLINDFEKMLTSNGTRILKFFLHISPEEQLERFKQRLNDPSETGKSLIPTIPSVNSGQNTSMPTKCSGTDKHQTRSVVRYPSKPQVVSRSGHL